MSKEKILKLTKYLEDHKARLSAPVPEKHREGAEAYKQYLKFEIDRTAARIDELKLGSGPEASKK